MKNNTKKEEITMNETRTIEIMQGSIKIYQSGQTTGGFTGYFIILPEEISYDGKFHVFNLDINSREYETIEDFNDAMVHVESSLTVKGDYTMYLKAMKSRLIEL